MGLDGNFNPFTHEWVNLGYLLSQISQISNSANKGMVKQVENHPKSIYNAYNNLYRQIQKLIDYCFCNHNYHILYIR